jgi:Zn-dependent protease with chaperone function
MALLWLGPALGFVLGILGDAIVLMLTHKQATRPPVLLTTFAAAMAGALVVRYKWLRELWGPRVTFRSWLAGSLVVLLGIAPGLLMTLVLILLLPDTINAQALITFIAAILVVGFFALGGNLKLLGWIGIMNPAPSVLTDVVDQLARLMNVQGEVRAFVLEWAMVNAVAWQRNRAIGFSRALLEVMTDNEVRAVAAHELAHLVEPLWVRRIRTAHVFVYLPLVPLAKYGGLSYMWFLMRSIRSSFSCDALGFLSSPLPRSLTEASEASRSQGARQGTGGGGQRCGFQCFAPVSPLLQCPLPGFMIFLLRQESETAALAQRTAVACASSSSSWTVFSGQSVVQLEPHTPSAQNSNRCQSVGVSRQLVSVRMS